MAKPSTMSRNGGDLPTLGTAWRSARERGYLKELPSGNHARLRPVSPDLLITRGDVPDMLTPLVTRMLFEGVDDPKAEVERALDTQALVKSSLEAVELYNWVCRLAFVEPRIVDEPQADDEISIDDVSLEDRGFVFAIVTGGAERLRSFRLEPPTDVESVPDVQDAEGEAEPPSGDEQSPLSAADG